MAVLNDNNNDRSQNYQRLPPISKNKKKHACGAQYAVTQSRMDAHVPAKLQAAMACIQFTMNKCSEQ